MVLAFIAVCFLLYCAYDEYNIFKKKRFIVEDNYKTIKWWNRDTIFYPSSGHHVTNKRLPSRDLDNIGYRVGMLLAHENKCSQFSLDNKDSIAQFCYCSYFFPELKEEYIQKVSNFNKISFDTLCKKD